MCCVRTRGLADSTGKSGGGGAGAGVAASGIHSLSQARCKLRRPKSDHDAFAPRTKRLCEPRNAVRKLPQSQYALGSMARHVYSICTSIIPTLAVSNTTKAAATVASCTPPAQSPVASPAYKLSG